MDPVTLGIVAVVVLLVLTMVGTPIAFALTLVAIVGNLFVFTPEQTASRFYEAVFQTGTDFILAAVPLFIFMGQLVNHGNIGRDLYDAVYKWFGRVPGGLAVTAVISSAGFGAVTGLSAASVATMGAITLPEMKRYGYDPRIAAGSIAIASTLSILIPPSLLLILYGLWTETSIGHLFIAGIIPGILLAICFCAYILIRFSLNRELGSRGERFSYKERFRALTSFLPIIGIFGVVIVGLYGGVFTVSEAAGVGASAVLVLLLVMRRLSWPGLLAAVRETAQLTVMVMTIFVAATFFAKFLVVTDLTYILIEFIEDLSVNRYVVLLALIAMYLVMGMVLDTIGMLLLTLPFVFPIIQQLGFDPVWFGIILTILVEIALVTPPVGFNCFVIRQIAPDISLKDIFLGVGPFVLICLAVLGLLIAFPQIVLFL
jgi:C4-dicarboxylate transporter, DctM subunit